ncbi:hypothetical protein [Prevotella pectinovora]|jgi:hypothetical protein|uniref:hypothetical protein n=1 Tax=Prevotella pectinovora TaxID=1602169 RepID=UPI0025966D60|nr:hypothetical protein [uncultured Prevotella sp.]
MKEEHPSFYSFATAKVVIIIGKSSYTNDGSTKKAELSHSVNHKKMIPQQALYAKGPSKEIGLDLFTTY